MKVSYTGVRNAAAKSSSVPLRGLAAPGGFLTSRPKALEARRDCFGNHPSETVGVPGLPVLNFQPRRGTEISGQRADARPQCVSAHLLPHRGLDRSGSPARTT